LTSAKIFEQNGSVASGVTLGKELITDQAAFEELAHYIDSQEGEVTKCTMGPIAQVATHKENPGIMVRPIRKRVLREIFTLSLKEMNL
jgi:hypothetical protein